MVSEVKQGGVMTKEIGIHVGKSKETFVYKIKLMFNSRF